MKKYTLLALCLCLGVGAHGADAAAKPTDANLYGHVVDRETHEHIPYAAVAVSATAFGTTTDSSGHYFLKNLPEGELTIEVRALGYAPLRQVVTLRRGQTAELNFEVAQSGISMDEVVVTASRSERLRREAPSLVSVLDAAVFEKANASCLAQGLSFQPGVRVEDDCQNCGFMQVRINGLDGHYSQILIDSHPVFSALTGVYGLEQIPANMIERVEVLRGGGSALFGSSAIGGTINVITREPARSSAELSHTLTAVGGRAYDNSTMLNASLVADDGRAGICVFGQNRHRSGYDHDGDGFTELPAIRSQSVGMRSFYRTGAYSRITAQYHHIGEYRRGGDELDLPPHQAMIAEQVDHSIDGGSLSFDITSADLRNRLNAYASFQNTARRSYYGSKQDPDAYGKTHDLTVAAGMQYIRRFGRFLFMPSELTVGTEYSYDALEDNPFGYPQLATGQTVHIAGAYLQNEWKTKRWSLLVGGRLDKHNLVDHAIFSPRANIRFNPTESVNLRASYAGGYRAPQAFDEDMHIAIVGGERVRIRLSDDLREERSHSVSLSADLYHSFGRVQTNLLVEGFYTLLDDVFALRDLSERAEDGSVVKERYNGSGATVRGVNVEGRAAFTRWFELQAGMTWQRSRYTEPEAWSEDEDVPPVRRMFRTPDLYGYFTASFKPFKRFAADVTGTCTGEMLVQHMAGSGTERDEAVTTPAFCDVNLRLAYDLPLYKGVVLQLHGGVQNLFNAYQKDFDRGPDRDSGYVYGPSLPRSWFVGAKVRF